LIPGGLWPGWCWGGGGGSVGAAGWIGDGLALFWWLEGFGLMQ